MFYIASDDRGRWQVSSAHRISSNLVEVSNADFDLCFESQISKHKTIVRLIDQTVALDLQTTNLDVWASGSTTENRVLFLLPADNPSDQSLAFQTIQLRCAILSGESVPMVAHS